MSANQSDRRGALLTAEDVQQWQSQVAMLEDRVRRDQAEIARLKRYLEAASVFMKGTGTEAIARTANFALEVEEPQPELPPLTDVFLEIFRDQNGELTQRMIKSALPEEWQRRLKDSPNYFYTALHRMVQRGHLTRRGVFFSLPKRLAPSGEP